MKNILYEKPSVPQNNVITKILPDYAQKSPGTLALIGGGGEGIVKNLNWIRGRQQQLRWKHLIRALVGGA